MSALLERLRAALEPDYEIQEELASGGMGVLFLGRDVALDRRIVVKIIRPDLATAVAAERFLREARTLASVNHPNVMTVHRAGEADGLVYYVMDYLEGDTLAARLARGPLPTEQVFRLGNELLAALEVVHERAIVHRDIKPSNVFFVGGRAVLGDFGISKSVSGDAATLTAPGHLVGTPGYMPPEQLAGGEVTESTDLCAVGMVLYEAFTGRQWAFDSHTEAADWRGVPGSAVPALRRALAWSPRERWQTAAEFRRALSGGAARPSPRRWKVAAAVAAAVAVLWLWFGGMRRPPSHGLSVAVLPFTAQGPASEGLGDSAAQALVGALRAAPDIAFCYRQCRQGRGAGQADLEVSGIVTGRGELLHVDVRGTSGSRTGAAFRDSATGGLADVVDALASRLLLHAWTALEPKFGTDLPVQALPRSPAGKLAWARAEGLYARAQWGAADTAYNSAIATDSTCLLCYLRLSHVARWLRLDQDPEWARRYLAHLDAFPPRYRSLILAGVDSTDRWGALSEMAAHAPNFALAHFVYGEELFNRGPLAGRRRAEALGPLKRAVQLWPDFAPGWEQLAWALIAEGDSAGADSALTAYRHTAAANDFSTQLLGALLNAGFAWRFSPPVVASRVTQQVLDNPVVSGYPDLATGAKYLVTMDAPAGLVWVGERFAAWPGRRDLLVPGLVAQIVGLTALGRADSAAQRAERLSAVSADARTALPAMEFRAFLVLFDSLDARAVWLRLEPGLAALTGEGVASPAERRRVAWVLTLLARRAGDALAARRWRGWLAEEPAPRPFTLFLEADSVGATEPRRALDLTAPLLALDSASRTGDPFFRAALHLARAGWHVALGDPLGAARELRWHENSDFLGRGDPLEAAEVDAAFGTIARWNTARVLDDANLALGEACSGYAVVARLWRGGDQRYAQRAAVAERRRAERCGSIW